MKESYKQKLSRTFRSVIFFFRKIRFSIRNNQFSKGAYVGSNVQLRKCKIGAYSSIGSNSVLNRAKVGSYCSLAACVMIGGEEHAYWDISTSNHLSDNGISEVDTHIGHDVWIGAQCYVRQGVKIGNGVVIGSNSFVNTDIPDYAIAVGSPARVIKYRFDEQMIKLINESHYWDYNPIEARQIINKITKRE